MNDLSDMLVKGAIDGVKDIVKDVVKSAAQYGRKEYSKLLIDFEHGFETFLERNYKRLFRIKTLLNPARPVSLEACYVPPNLRIARKTISEKDFVSLIDEDKFFVVTGMGGSGKSVFLKHLYIRFYLEKRGRVPFFLELRDIKPETKLTDYMLAQLSAVSSIKIDSELFNYALKAGKFLLLLDGFDEIDPDMRENLAKQILALSYEYDGNAIVLTSRPDGPFGSWNEFHVLNMEPFEKKQVLSLISKMRYDKSAKKDFGKLVKDGIYETHREYLSNPLLATLMLLTYDQGAEIPTRMHVFFERAFEVLFYKHDATKQTSFRRKFKTSLAADEFRSTFSTFSAFTYLDHGSSFTHTQAIKSASAAIEYNSNSEKAENLLYDLTTSVSVLVREGESYNYIHRSLQEFFVAQFLAHRELEGWDDIVERIVKDRPNDTVVRQLADINRDRFEQQFLLPRMASLRSDIEAIDVEKEPSKIFQLFYITFSVRDQNVETWTVGHNAYHPPWYYITTFIERAPEFGDPDRFLLSFNWLDHFAKHGIALINEGPRQQVKQISDDAIKGTPMMNYVKNLRATSLAMHDRLQKNKTKKNKLLSTALIKKKLS